MKLIIDDLKSRIERLEKSFVYIILFFTTLLLTILAFILDLIIRKVT